MGKHPTSNIEHPTSNGGTCMVERREVGSAFHGGDLIQPFQGSACFESPPRVASQARQPWAERYNPFGIGCLVRRSLSLIAFLVLSASVARAQNVSIVIASNAAPRVEFGAEKLVEALKAVNLNGAIVRSDAAPSPKIFVNRPHTL